MSNQKGLAPILIVLLIGIIGVAGFFGYKYLSLRGVSPKTDDVAIYPTPTPPPTPDETANWKTYTSSNLPIPGLDFSIKYPATYEVNEIVQHLNVSFRNPTDVNAFKIAIFVQRNLNPGKLAPADWFREDQKEIGGNPNVPLQEITIGTLKGTKLDSIDPKDPDSKSFTAYIAKDTSIISVGVSVKENQVALANQMLATFKFTDQNSSDEVTAAVKAYALNNGYKKPVIISDFIKETQARGNIGDEGVAGGAKWFAAKIKGTWTVVWVGNGLPDCASVAKYNLPKDFLACY